MDRPELDEFLSALNGFLDKQTTPQDPSYQKFLEIFCRSLGAGEGHLLKATSGRGLESVVSYGIGPEFDVEFNSAHAAGGNQASPLDRAFAEQKVVAIVEIRRDGNYPAWFLDLMTRHEFKSLVAVPLLGAAKTVGILCAYYHDVCLFDQGTLDRLLVIGRMVGAATEKSVAAGRVESYGAKEKAIDEMLHQLLLQPFNKIQVFGLLSRIAGAPLQVSGLICGPLRWNGPQALMTVADGSGIPASLISQRCALPAIVGQALASKPDATTLSMRPDEWSGLGPLSEIKAGAVVCAPLIWQGQVQAGVVAWKPDGQSFEDDDGLLLARLAGIASLALNIS